MGNRQKLVDFFMDELDEESPWLGRVRELVDKLVAEDFEFVVRCKDCVHFTLYGSSIEDCRCDWLKTDYIKPDGFCDQGRKKVV